MTKLSLISILYFVVVIVALHFLRPDHNPISQTTSQYVGGPYGLLMTTAFFSISLASIALIAGIHQKISPAARSRSGLGLLAIWAVAVLMAMIFPINQDGTPLTTSGLIHRITGPLGFLSLAIGAILLSRSFRHDENFRRLHRPALILSWLMFVMFMVTFANIATGSGFAGLSQRILLTMFVIWLLLISLSLHTMTTKNNIAR